MNVATILKLKGGGVVTAKPDTSLLEIAQTLGQNDIGCIVIEGDDGRIAGIVSERDIVRVISQVGAKGLKEPVKSCMTEKVVTAREADTTDRLMAEMTTHRFRHMPVVERGRLIGLVSIGDVVKLRIREVDMEAADMRNYIKG
jgi:CBS domain-containing protein